MKDGHCGQEGEYSTRPHSSTSAPGLELNPAAIPTKQSFQALHSLPEHLSPKNLQGGRCLPEPQHSSEGPVGFSHAHNCQNHARVPCLSQTWPCFISMGS